jgi:hypothetical protein
MKLKNFWLQKIREKSLLKIVEWAQKNGKKVEDLSRDDVREAIVSQR